MTTLQAKRLKSALAKAKRVGHLEESLTIDGCQIVLQTHRPEAYVDIEAETEDLDGAAKFQVGFYLAHLCRAIVEIEGQDLRDVKYIEDEEDGKPVTLERHEWVRKNILSEWGNEALLVAFRKLLELLGKAGDRAKEGIKFEIPDESQEEKLRRLLGEIREIDAQLPDDLLVKVYQEYGLAKVSSTEELEEAGERAKKFVAAPPPPPKFVAPSEEVPEEEDTASAEDLMRQRAPLNRPVSPEPELREQVKARARAIAEAEDDLGLTDSPVPPESFHKGEIVQKLDRDPNARVVVDKSPAGGINPRFQPRRR